MCLKMNIAASTIKGIKILERNVSCRLVRMHTLQSRYARINQGHLFVGLVLRKTDLEVGP